jgi:hypothetical protein
MHEPAQISCQLLRFRTRQKRAEVQSVQKPALADPMAFVNHLPVQQGNLPGRTAERQQSYFQPHPERSTKRWHPVFGQGWLGNR